MARLSKLWMAAGLALLAGSALALADGKTADAKPKEVPAPDYKISGPYTHDNLTIFLLHGKDTLTGKNILTLQEALEQKKCVVHETKNVNELSVENVSADVDVYVQAGDIVKGGQQDRILSYDMILSPKSGKVPVASFCCESGRWRQRGGEAVGRFEASANVANSKELKVAAQSAMKGQDLVWKKVKEAQTKLEKNVGQKVENSASPTSLQLTLEDKKLLEEVEKYVKALTKAPEGKGDVIGYAIAINGKVEAADVYGSNSLFLKLWPKLINGSATEALTEKEKDKKFDAAKAEDVKKFLADVVTGKRTEKDLTKRVKTVCAEDEKNLFLETRDNDKKGEVIHRSYLKK
jgi:hypothetical protein